MVGTRSLHKVEQNRRPFLKPCEDFLADLEMLGISRLHIGFVDRVEPCALPMLISGEGVRQTLVLILSK